MAGTCISTMIVEHMRLVGHEQRLGYVVTRQRLEDVFHAYATFPPSSGG